MDPVTILGLIAGLLGGAATILTFYLKRKQDKKEDQDALGRVEAAEVRDGIAAVRKFYREHSGVQQPPKEGKN